MRISYWSSDVCSSDLVEDSSLETAQRQLRTTLQPVVGGIGAGSVDEVQRVGVARAGGAVRPAAVRQLAVQHHQRALRRFQRNPRLRPGRVVQALHRQRAILAPPTLAQGALVRAGQRPEAAVLQRRILEREPQADDAQRVRSEEHTSELQSLMRTSYAVFCLKKQK